MRAAQLTVDVAGRQPQEQMDGRMVAAIGREHSSIREEGCEYGQEVQRETGREPHQAKESGQVSM